MRITKRTITIGICFVALTALAATWSFSNFPTTQFAQTSDGKAAIKSGAALTNIAFTGTMSGGNIAYTSASSVSFANQVSATIFVGNLSGDASTADALASTANLPYGSTAGPMLTTNANNLAISYNAGALTNLPAASLTGSIADARLSANVPLLNAANAFTANQKITGGLEVTGIITNDNLTASTVGYVSATKTVTNLPNGTGVLRNNGSGGMTWDNTVLTTAPNVSWTTNAVAAADAFPVATNGVYSTTNAAGNIAYTSVSGVDASFVTWGSQIIDANGGDRTLTLPASWRVPDGVRTITVTNGTIGTLSVLCYANKYTNAFYRPGY